MEIERRTIPVGGLKVERREADKTPMIRGYAAVFNKPSEDLGGFIEYVAPGAFANVLKADPDVRGLFNHDSNMILGRTKAGTLRLSEDKEGLAIEIDPPDTQVGRDVVGLIERGDVDGMSFSFTVKAQEWRDGEDGKPTERTITEVGQLFDVGPVTFPAYPDTSVAARSLADWKATHNQPPRVDLRDAWARQRKAEL